MNNLSNLSCVLATVADTVSTSAEAFCTTSNYSSVTAVKPKSNISLIAIFMQVIDFISKRKSLTKSYTYASY